VDAGSRGDTIVVRAGTYRESVTIHTNGLTLRAQGACPRSGFDSR
jgi:hypothetical protein